MIYNPKKNGQECRNHLAYLDGKISYQQYLDDLYNYHYEILSREERQEVNKYPEEKKALMRMQKRNEWNCMRNKKEERNLTKLFYIFS